MELNELKNELELKTIRWGSGNEKVSAELTIMLSSLLLSVLWQVTALAEEVAACKRELKEIKIQERNLNAYQRALNDLRAAEDHRKPRSQPASPYTSPDMGPADGAITAAKPPGSPALAAMTDPNFEGSKRLLPDVNARKKPFDAIKVSPKWDKPATYQKVRAVRNV